MGRLRAWDVWSTGDPQELLHARDAEKRVITVTSGPANKFIGGYSGCLRKQEPLRRADRNGLVGHLHRRDHRRRSQGLRVEGRSNLEAVDETREREMCRNDLSRVRPRIPATPDPKGARGKRASVGTADGLIADEADRFDAAKA